MVVYLIDFVILSIIYLFLFKRWKTKGNDRLFINSLMFVYLCFVLYFTLMPIVISLPHIFDHPYVLINMKPFDDFFFGREDAVRQIILNVIMMIPFGFLLPILKKRTLAVCVLYTFVLSFCIEMLQPLISGFRSADITDLITNTVGGIIGYALYRLCAPLVNSILRYFRQ